jgi:peptidoglycan/LPS O-acetylase OafA/YrhL
MDVRWTAGPLLLAAAVIAYRRPALGDDRLPGLLWTQTIAAALVVAVPLLSATLRTWADARPLVLLGRISFGLYLAHMLVLASLGSATYVLLRRSLAHDPAALIASGTTLIASLIAGSLLYVLADRPAVRCSAWIVDQLFAPRADAASPLAMPNPSVRRQAA